MKKFLKYGLAVLAILMFGALLLLWKAAPVATGYSAKYLCSHVFTSGQDAGEAMEIFIKPVNPLFKTVTYSVDHNRKLVTTKLFGLLRPTTAVYREGCGCTLLVDQDRTTLIDQSKGLLRKHLPRKDTLWPTGERTYGQSVPANVDLDQLNQRLAREFEETSTNPEERINTMAIVVAYKDRIIAERYRPGITDSTPLLSWSASKSITGALIGRLVQTQGLDIHQPVGFEAWKNDARSGITLDHLLRMESGLAFDERYAPLSDAVEMLYESTDMGAYAMQKPLKAVPGTKWQYSSGTTNLLAKILLEKTGGNLRRLDEFAYNEFFHKLGMTTAIFEHDESGAYVGSSYFYASPKDWLRFALLFKNKGVWNGEQVLPEGWVDYALTPTPHAPEGRYGAQIWLNAGAPGSDKRLLPKLPADTFVFQGYQGQWIVVIPSRDVMIARFGVTNTKNWRIEDLIVDILETIETGPAENGPG